MKFSEMNISSPIIRGLSEINIESPTEIQKQSIQIMLKDQTSHVIGQARTGSGKTLAFAVPMATYSLWLNVPEVNVIVNFPGASLVTPLIL